MCSMCKQLAENYWERAQKMFISRMLPPTPGDGGAEANIPLEKGAKGIGAKPPD